MAKMGFSSLVLSLFLCNAALGQARPSIPSGKLAGDVADKTENALISTAFVFVHRPDGKKDVIVKVSDGRFQLSLPAGLYDVFIAASGFAPSCHKIRISVGRTTTLKPQLERDAESLDSGLEPGH